MRIEDHVKLLPHIIKSYRILGDKKKTELPKRY
jgi:hypothetical protein